MLYLNSTCKEGIFYPSFWVNGYGTWSSHANMKSENLINPFLHTIWNMKLGSPKGKKKKKKDGADRLVRIYRMYLQGLRDCKVISSQMKSQLSWDSCLLTSNSGGLNKGKHHNIQGYLPLYSLPLYSCHTVPCDSRTRGQIRSFCLL